VVSSLSLAAFPRPSMPLLTRSCQAGPAQTTGALGACASMHALCSCTTVKEQKIMTPFCMLHTASLSHSAHHSPGRPGSAKVKRKYFKIFRSRSHGDYSCGSAVCRVVLNTLLLGNDPNKRLFRLSLGKQFTRHFTPQPMHNRAMLFSFSSFCSSISPLTCSPHIKSTL